MKHGTTVRILLTLWALCVYRVAFAATFTLEFRGFDYESLMWGAIAGLLGGALRTIFTLANENRAVFVVLKEARKDLVISFIAGGIMYLLLLAISSKYPDLITREIRFVAIGAAGWMRSAFITGLGVLIKSKFDKTNDDLRSGAATSGVVPLMPPLPDNPDAKP